MFDLWLQLLILLPFATAAIVLTLGRFPNIREALSLGAGVMLIGIALWVYSNMGEMALVSIVWAEPVPGLSLSFKLDELGMLFILVATVLWPITTLYAIGYMRAHNEPRQTTFFAWFAIAIGSTLAIALAANLFTLFVFYEVLTLSTYPLVTHGRDEAAKKGGRTYLMILLGTSITFLLPAIIGTWVMAGSLDFKEGGVFAADASVVQISVLLALFVVGIGKAAIMPFHRWLPAAMVAPTPVSALLHAVAVVKAGAFAMLKVCALIFGLDLLALLPASTWLAYLAALSIVIASVIALREDNLKRRLAYSTIGQLNYITLGALLATSSAFVGSAMHIAMHAFAKITLFFCAGAILVVSHKTRVSELTGLGRRMPLTMIAFFIGSLGIVGVPPTGGTWSKWYLLMGTLDSGQWVLAIALMLSSLLSIVYLLAIPVRAFLPTGSETEAGWIPERMSPMLLAILLTSIATITLFFFPQTVFELASAIVPAGGGHGR